MVVHIKEPSPHRRRVGRMTNQFKAYRVSSEARTHTRSVIDTPALCMSAVLWH